MPVPSNNNYTSRGPWLAYVCVCVCVWKEQQLSSLVMCDLTNGSRERERVRMRAREREREKVGKAIPVCRTERFRENRSPCRIARTVASVIVQQQQRGTNQNNRHTHTHTLVLFFLFYFTFVPHVRPYIVFHECSFKRKPRLPWHDLEETRGWVGVSVWRTRVGVSSFSAERLLFRGLKI